MVFNSKWIYLILLPMYFFSEAWCIRCYYCNSANNTACLDVNLYSEEIRSRIVPIVTCETAIPSPGGYHFFCRKIVQTIFHSNRQSDVRVTRGCGWIRHEYPCYREDNGDHLGTVCQCFEDYCNTSDRVEPASMAGLFFLLAAILYLWR